MDPFTELLADFGSRSGSSEAAARRCPLSSVAGGLTPSPEPAVVLASLARSCVPAFTDRCTLELVEPGRPVYRYRYPRIRKHHGGVTPIRTATERAGGGVLRTRFRHDASAFGPACSGEFVHCWVDFTPGPVEERTVALLIECALDVVREQRIAAALAQADYPAMTMAMWTMKRMLVATDQMSAAIDQLQVAAAPSPSTLDNLRRAGQEAEQLLDELAAQTRSRSS